MREALPVFLGKTNSAAVQPVIPPEQMDSLSPEKLQEYLGLTKKELAEKDRETLQLLMELKVESAAEAPDDKDAKVNTTDWRYVLSPYQWSGYDKPEYIWQPVSQIQKFNIIPLIVGSLKVTFVALVFAVPIALGAAIYVSQLARPRVKEVVKPIIEMLSGIPSVVLGFFALMVLAGVLQTLTGQPIGGDHHADS